MKPIRLAFATILVLLLAVGPAKARELTLATWNIANLHHESGIHLRDQSDPEREPSPARRDLDYQRLALIAARVSADVFLLQEIGSPRALARVFPEAEYHLVLSSRYEKGVEERPATRRDIFVAVAVSKKAFPTLPENSTVDAFSILHIDMDRRTGRPTIQPTRAALQILLPFGDVTLSVLNVHLKSSCHQFPLARIEDQNFFSGKSFASRFDCRTLRGQLGILESWIEVERRAGRVPIVAGDFNRRLNAIYRNPTRSEDFWNDLNDGEPDGLSLSKAPLHKDTVCWPNYTDRYKEHIDFFVYDDSLSEEGRRIEVLKLGLGYDDVSDYSEADPDFGSKSRERLSDHCPVVMTIITPDK